MRNYFPKRTSVAPLHTLSKLYDVPVGFVSPSLVAMYCYICGRLRVAVARYRMICLVLGDTFSGLRRLLEVRELAGSNPAGSVNFHFEFSWAALSLQLGEVKSCMVFIPSNRPRYRQMILYWKDSLRVRTSFKEKVVSWKLQPCESSREMSPNIKMFPVCVPHSMLFLVGSSCYRNIVQYIFKVCLEKNKFLGTWTLTF